MKPSHAALFTAALLLFSTAAASAPKTCVVGSGIAGSSVSYFLKHYTCTLNSPVDCIDDIQIFERRRRVGGRTATVNLSGDVFEAGASIIHPKNFHALNFTKLLGLKIISKSTPEFTFGSNSSGSGSDWFGIWDGSRFVFKTLKPLPSSSSWIFKKIYELLDSLLIFKRYGLSLLRMNNFVKKLLDKFLKYYEGFENRPVFNTVEEMLKWSGLHELTQRTLEEELEHDGLCHLLISELVTVITRINYGQSVSISGLAGAVSLAGSDSGLWSVKGGNWQIAAGLINYSNVTLHLDEEINSISYDGSSYVLESAKGNSYNCDVTIIATPLDEINIGFSPSISVPSRKLQHTFTTFVRGILNPKYFGVSSVSDIPDLIGTLELPEIPFSSLSVLKTYDEEDKAYKIFSRAPLPDGLLDSIFSLRKETIKMNWAAYPHYEAPEVFAPIILDGQHLYYINAFENAASTIETGAVAAENVARLIVSRLSGLDGSAQVIEIPASDHQILHLDL